MNRNLVGPPPQSAAVGRTAESNRIALAVANESDRNEIYRLRHEIYAGELGQHAVNAAGELQDSLDNINSYLVARICNQIAGFVSITPPGAGGYSIDKYVPRSALPFAFDDRLYEIRLLTVIRPHRGRELATLLMYAAFRWIEAHGGTRIVAIGRREVVEMYLRSGLIPTGRAVQSGAVTYDLLHSSLDAIRERIKSFGGLIERIEGKTDWQLNFPFRKPAACFHGGAFFEAIGANFDALNRRHSIINADVLDAWFPPSPKVLDTLREHLPWLLQTSPPTGCEGLIDTIARVRGVRPDNILPGAGSSDLIFRTLRSWLTPASHALLLDPTYGEYAHVLERVIGCTVDRLPLRKEDHYTVNLERLEAALRDEYDLVVLVNPNSPTGRHIERKKLERVIACVPARTRIWIDETYVDYVGANQSLERFAAASENVLVCKSMSKAYALSGTRAAYLCAGPHQLEALRAITPPWVVGLPAQVAAVRALEDPEYYATRRAETQVLREHLAVGLRRLGWEVIPGVANFLLCHLPPSWPTAAVLVKCCREQGLFLRNASPMGAQLGDRAVRMAVKDAATNQQIIETLSRYFSCGTWS